MKGLRATMPSTDVRIMEIPRNGLGLGEGVWFRWDELDAWLRAEGYNEAAEKLARAKGAPSIATKEIRLRR